ncbi:MAG: hypothetical protein JWM31_174, partial [Solirubrobacterales bacterium]|nr:hypothetical protein [Solirubrobacterales bacterium]
MSPLRAHPQPAAAAAIAPGPAMMTLRPQLADGRATSLYVAAFPLAGLRVKVRILDQPETLVRWCRAGAVPHAIVGGFFVRPHNAPLGELRVGGAP